MHCRLLIPDLFLPDAAFIEALSPRRFPSIETLIARGRRSTQAWPGLGPWLLEAFSVERQEDWPSAPFSLLGEGRAPGDAFWAHAEPVHLRAERDRLVLADASMLEISAAEALALTASINAHFGGAVHLDPVNPGSWYARIESPPSGSTVPARDASGALPEESASIGWHALMNEMQMLLHEHPVNEAREARRVPPVNGVWLWGGGRLAQAKAPPVRAVLSSNPLAAGLAQASGVRHGRLPENVDRWLESTQPDGVCLVLLEALGAPARRGDAESWIAALQEIERNFVEPLSVALGRGRIGMLTLHLAGAGRLLDSEAIRGDLHRFWRRRQPLAGLAAAN